MHDRPAFSVDRRAFLVEGAAATLAAASVGACAPGPPEKGDEKARLDELFAHLEDQRASGAPISASERRDRRARLGRILAAQGADAIVMESGTTMSYLTGVTWGRSERLFALVVTAEGAHLWLCPAFEESKARLSIDAESKGDVIVAWQEHEYPYKPLASALRERRCERVLVEPQLRCVFAERLAREIGRERVRLGDEAVIALRAKKDVHEIALLRRASELTQLAIQAVAPTLVPGLTGVEIGARIDRAHQRLGMRSPWNLSLIGAAAALPHGDPNAKPLEKGSVLLMDTGGSFHGYQSDVTRTWIFDASPDADVERAWNAVRDAQLRAFDAIRPGALCKSVDAAARAVIAERGFGAGYAALTHRLGHGIGMEGHEDPYFDGGNEVKLESGMTLSNEPGIYVPQKFGVRLEDIVLVTETGADHFGAWQTSPGSPA
jgi:Xaa-Pro dipeptidase